MYKVFINEKQLSISNYQIDKVENLFYNGVQNLTEALYKLENSSKKHLHIYGENIDEIWENFVNLFQKIEAAGGIVSNENDEILFINRLQKWDLPKGKIEKNETKKSAATREVEEETGLCDLILQDFIGTTYHIYYPKNSIGMIKFTHWFSMRYTGNQTPTPQIEEGIQEVKWIKKSQISTEVFPNTFENIILILKSFGI